MDYSKKVKTSILMPLCMIPPFVIAVILAVVGYKTMGDNNPVYVIGLILALIIGFLGGFVAEVLELVAAVRWIKARNNNCTVPVGFTILLVVEILLTQLWVYMACAAFMNSMSV